MHGREYRWAVFNVLRDWQARRLKKLRLTTPPADYTSSTLEYIRTLACHEAGASNCLYWAMRRPAVEDEDDSPFFPSVPGAEPTTELSPEDLDDHPCDRCLAPVVTVATMERELLLAHSDNADHDGRYWRRYVNERQPMTRDNFLRAIAQAWGNGWLSPWQTVTIFQHIISMHAASSFLRRTLKRLQGRQKVGKTVDIEVDLSEIASEEEKLWQDFFCKSAARIARARHLSDEEKQRLLADLELPQNCATERAKSC